jgi:hypothetical protein
MNTCFTQQPSAFRIFLSKDGNYRPQYKHEGGQWTNFVKDSKFVQSKSLTSIEKYLKTFTWKWSYEEDEEEVRDDTRTD